MSLHSSCGMEEMEVSCVTLKVVGSSALKLVKLYEWQRQQLTAAVLSWKTAVNVTCSQGGSGSKGTSWKGRSLSDLSSLFPTPCLHHFTLFAYQITSPEFLAAHWSMQASCHVGITALPLTLWLCTVTQENLENLAPEAQGAPRSAAELPEPAVPLSNQAGSHYSYCENCLSRTTQLSNRLVFSTLGYVLQHANLAL